MPRYCFVCVHGHKKEVVRPMADAMKPWRCACGKKMQRDLRAEGTFAGGNTYNKVIHSDSLAISPTQRAEHERLFPNIKLDEQCRPVFDNFKKHDKYLEQTGFIKHPAKRKKRNSKRIA